jgi:hypothetical protein
MRLYASTGGTLQITGLPRFSLRLRRCLIYALSVSPILWNLSRPPQLGAQTLQPTRRVNAPYFDGTVLGDRGALFWFGQIDHHSNYADVRLGYNNHELELTLNIIDRRLWYDTAPVATELAAWDAVSLYLHLDGNTGDALTSDSYRFVAQANWWEERDEYQAAYQGNGATWLAASTPFTTTSGWRGDAPIDDQDDQGWWVQFRIPFSSLELSGPPRTGSVWGLALVLHDRDDEAGTPIPDQIWPEAVDTQHPSTWGQLAFGLPGYDPPAAIPGELVAVRQGLDGAVVVDAHVGGHTTCGEGLWPDIFANWGEANYAGYDQINIQNQRDVADWPCFSKYYVTFPLDALPSGNTVISATLTMYLFGNAGYEPGDSQPSLVQALTVAEDWNEAILTWNNAPLAVENTAATWVYPVDFYHPGVPYQWNVSWAVAQAYAVGDPLRLALYSADSEYHSGKYFWSADAEPSVRPNLQVLWGDPIFDLTVGPPMQSIEASGVATYAIRVQHSQGFTHTVTLQVGPSPSPFLALDLAPTTSFAPPGGQTTLTLRDLHDPSFEDGLWYTIPITATGGGFAQTASVGLFVNGRRSYLPLILR